MRYLAPTTVAETLDLLAEHGDDAKLLAGGQSLLILMRERLVTPDVLIGLTDVAELRGVEVDGEARIGAMTTHATVAADAAIGNRWPVLAATEATVSTTQIRNRGTIGGNVAHAFPTADPPAALIALDARIHLASRAGGERVVPVEEFFAGLMETVAQPDELLTTISLPPQPDGAFGAYVKYAVRPLDFAIVGAAARITLDGDGTVSDVRIGLNGAADRAMRAVGAEAALLGERISAALLARAGEVAARDADPIDDIDGSSDYKRHVVGVYTRRVLEQAVAGASGDRTIEPLVR
jgi:carbon-monoxide dehydrogenase medium subunit